MLASHHVRGGQLFFPDLRLIWTQEHGAAGDDHDEPQVGWYEQHQGQHNGAASARGSMSDKLSLKERITAWKKDNIRAFELLWGDIPKGCDLPRVQ